MPHPPRRQTTVTLQTHCNRCQTCQAFRVSPGGGGRGMDGWWKLAGGGGAPWDTDTPALLADCPDQLGFLEFGAPVGSADPWDLGSCVIEHVTCQLLVGIFSPPPPGGGGGGV